MNTILFFLYLLILYSPCYCDNFAKSSFIDPHPAEVERREFNERFDEFSKEIKPDLIVSAFIRYVKKLECTDKKDAINRLVYFILDLEDSFRELVETGECDSGPDHEIIIYPLPSKI